ncbi:pilus assembly protein PilM [Patescibacteria group bacterium]|nr:pilus assembly protein PilM [Patescibacteria group bacterium]MBU1877174.1 pilus assembly protein PilM [Patescibacteria group bacterium]
MKLFNLKPESFALDISDPSLKVVKLNQSGNNIRLGSFGEIRLQPGIIKKGEIKREDDLIDAIKKSVAGVEGEKIKTKYVICSLPEEKAFLQVIKMPKMSDEDLKSAVIYESENYIPLPIESVYLDFQIVSSKEDSQEMEVLIAAFPKRIVDSYVNCLEKTGLKILSLEVESLAIARALVEKELTKKPVLLIDLGFSRTGFVIFSGTSVRFTSSIQVSSNNFTQIIAKNLNLEEQVAEKLKIRHGLDGKISFKIKEEKTEKKIEKGMVFEALIPALTDLVQQIKKCQDYYQNHAFNQDLPDNMVIEKVLLCGGGANLKGLAGLLSIELKIPVVLGNPWINILPKGDIVSPLSLEESLSYTTALGLALKGIQVEKL